MLRSMFILVIASAIVVGCTTFGRYTGNEYYYTQEGVRWSCRDPKPYLGGNCRPEAEWEQKGLN